MKKDEISELELEKCRLSDAILDLSQKHENFRKRKRILLKDSIQLGLTLEQTDKIKNSFNENFALIKETQKQLHEAKLEYNCVLKKLAGEWLEKELVDTVKLERIASRAKKIADFKAAAEAKKILSLEDKYRKKIRQLRKNMSDLEIQNEIDRHRKLIEASTDRISDLQEAFSGNNEK